MTVMVTGGAGYIGSHMVYELADARERVVVLDNLSTGFDWAVAKGVPLIVGETGDQALVARLIREHGVDAIIHFAASIVVPDSVRDPLGYYRNNTMNSRALIDSAVKAACAISSFPRPPRSTAIRPKCRCGRMRRRCRSRLTAGRS